MFRKGNQLWKLKKTFKHSEETKKKLSQRWRENHEWRVKVSGFQKGHKINVGKHWKVSEEGKQHLSEVRRGKHYSPLTEFKKGERRWLKNLMKWREKNGPWNKGKQLSAEHKRKLSLVRKGRHYPKLSLSKKLQWQDPKYKERVIRAQLKGLLKRPTSLEQKFINFFQEFNLPYKYVGDGSLLIGFKNPDFVNTNGEKICIEVANRVIAHHPEGWAENRIEHFKKYGWQCFVFHEEDLNSKNELLKKLS